MRKTLPGCRQQIAILTAEGAELAQPALLRENCQASCPLADSITGRRCLYRSDELPALLKLTTEQVLRLIATGQLTPILICGEERFDSREVSALIDSYIRVNRRKSDNDNYR